MWLLVSTKSMEHMLVHLLFNSELPVLLFVLLALRGLGRLLGNALPSKDT